LMLDSAPAAVKEPKYASGSELQVECATLPAHSAKRRLHSHRRGAVEDALVHLIALLTKAISVAQLVEGTPLTKGGLLEACGLQQQRVPTRRVIFLLPPMKCRATMTKKER
jgi:hypothetical protein